MTREVLPDQDNPVRKSKKKRKRGGEKKKKRNGVDARYLLMSDFVGPAAGTALRRNRRGEGKWWGKEKKGEAGDLSILLLSPSPA